MQLDSHTAQLFQAIAQDDEHAFQQLHESYYARLLVYGKAFTLDKELIRDHIQNLFVGIWQQRKKLANLKQPDAYLYAGLRNNLRSAIRQSNNRKRLLEKNWTPSKEELPKDADPEDYAYLHRLIESLPTKQKEVILLRFFHEKSYAEIGQIMSINGQIAQNYAAKALKKLRKHAHILEKIIYPMLALLSSNYFV
ncbi:MAG: sigma-70 family RNA polymerase sigma factor [Bacteroidota bacterium]